MFGVIGMTNYKKIDFNVQKKHTTVDNSNGEKKLPYHVRDYTGGYKGSKSAPTVSPLLQEVMAKENQLDKKSKETKIRDLSDK